MADGRVLVLSAGTPAWKVNAVLKILARALGRSLVLAPRVQGALLRFAPLDESLTLVSERALPFRDDLCELLSLPDARAELANDVVARCARQSSGSFEGRL